MKKIRNKETLINIIFSFILQICNIVSTFIIPRIILSYFGSEVNGLVSSITQFLSYISLVEGGVTGVITASLYKPLVDKDYNKVSSVINTANKFYKKIGLIFIIYSLVLSTAYPIIFNVRFSFLYVFSLTLILSLNLLIQYMYSLTLKTLLSADKKVYIVSLPQILIIVLNIIIFIVCVKLYPSIHILKLISGLLFLLQPLIYSKYINKNYLLDKEAPIDNELLNNRWNGFAINIAAFIHFSTDISVLTIFTNLSTVSIYSVYALVTSGLRTIINSISSGINPTIGHTLVRGNEEELIEKINIYTYITNMLVYFCFSVAGLLIVPFVMIYTKGITDTNYYQPLFGILLIISEALYLLKLPHLNLAYAANRFKEITKPAYIEAILNIVISVLLVRKYNLVGIAIGTITGMLYRLIFHVWFTKKIIKKYSISDYCFKSLIFTLSTAFGVFICYYLIPFGQYTILNWIIYGAIYSVIISIFLLAMSILFFKKELLFFKNYLKK